MVTPLTEHFSLEEFACNDADRTPVPAEYLPNVRRLAAQLEIVRQSIGQPVRVTSGYRTLAHNTAIGGATGSRHLTAQGADLVVAGMSATELFCAFSHLIRDGRVQNGGLGVYADGHVHYDTGTAGRRWAEGIAMPVCPPSQEGPDMSEMDQLRAKIQQLREDLGATNGILAAVGGAVTFRGAQVDILIAAVNDIDAEVAGIATPIDPDMRADLDRLKLGQAQLLRELKEALDGLSGRLTEIDGGPP